MNQFSGNYSQSMEKKMDEFAFAMRKYQNTLREIKRIEGIIVQQRRWNQARNYVTIASKEKQIERIKSTLVRPEDAPEGIHFHLKADALTANEVIVCKDLSKRFGGREIFRSMNLMIRRDEKLCLLGANGCGKKDNISNNIVCVDKPIFSLKIIMKHSFLRINTLSAVLLAMTAQVMAQEPTPPYLDDNQPIEVRVEDALSRMTLKEKIATVAREIYGAGDVVYAKEAETALKDFESLGYGNLPICMAKTQYSFSDDPTLLGRPSGFTMTIKNCRISAGAGFVVVLTGDIMTMPGLPKVPAAEKIDVSDDGVISGLF